MLVWFLFVHFSYKSADHQYRYWSTLLLLRKSTAQKTQISSPIWSLSPPGGKVTLC